MAKKNENFSLLLKGCDAKIRCPIFLFHCGTAPPPQVGKVLLIIEASRLNSDTLHSVGLLWTSDQPPSQRSLPDTIQRSQKKDIHVPSAIRTRNPGKRAAADPGIRRCGHRDRPALWLFSGKFLFNFPLYSEITFYSEGMLIYVKLVHKQNIRYGSA